MRRGEHIEAAGNQRRPGAVARASSGPASRAPEASVRRLSMMRSTTPRSRPRSSATRSRSAGSKAISPFIERAVMAATCVLDADFGGELVDAFLVDHRRIHVGDQDLLAASGQLPARRRRPARPTARRASVSVASGSPMPCGSTRSQAMSSAEPGDGACADRPRRHSARAATRARRVGMETSVATSGMRKWRTRAGADQERDPDSGADRERQVGAGAVAGARATAASSSTPIPCRPIRC